MEDWNTWWKRHLKQQDLQKDNTKNGERQRDWNRSREMEEGEVFQGEGRKENRREEGWREKKVQKD